MLEVNMLSSSSSYTVLHNERSQYKGELEVIRREIREYQSLNRRFPELQQNLSPLLEQAKDRSVHLHGKINVLENQSKAKSILHLLNAPANSPKRTRRMSDLRNGFDTSL